MIKKLILSVLLLAALSYTSVFAAENSNIERFYGSHGEISISKDISADTSLLVVKGDKDWASIKDDNSFLNTNTVFYEYVQNNASEYEFNFIVSGEGIYSAYFGDEKTLLVYADATANQTAIQSLLGCSATNILSTLDANYQSLASATSLYSVGNNGAADIIFKYLQGKSEVDRVLFAEAFDKAYLMAGINSGAVTNISDYLYSVGIKGKDAERYYRPEYATDIYTAVKGKTTITEFDNAIIESLILNTVSKGNDVSLIKEILIEYASQIGLNSTYITDAAMRAINKQNYASIDILKTTLATLYNNQNNNQNGQTPPPSGGGGGGGGSSYTSSSNQAASNTVGGIGMATSNQGNTTISVFNDLGGYDWAKPAIEGLYHKGIVSGKTVSEFYPADLVSREEFVTMLILATKLNVVAEDITFLDVPETAWFYEYVNRGYKSKIINGISDEYFGSGMPITRQDMAAMIYNTLNVCGIPLGETIINTYADENNIAGYAKPAVNHLSSNGIFSGYEDKSFKPLNNASRAEAAAVIFNMVNLMQAHKEV